MTSSNAKTSEIDESISIVRNQRATNCLVRDWLDMISFFLTLLAEKHGRVYRTRNSIYYCETAYKTWNFEAFQISDLLPSNGFTSLVGAITSRKRSARYTRFTIQHGPAYLRLRVHVNWPRANQGPGQNSKRIHFEKRLSSCFLGEAIISERHPTPPRHSI